VKTCSAFFVGESVRFHTRTASIAGKSASYKVGSSQFLRAATNEQQRDTSIRERHRERRGLPRDTLRPVPIPRTHPTDPIHFNAHDQSFLSVGRRYGYLSKPEKTFGQLVNVSVGPSRGDSPSAVEDRVRLRVVAICTETMTRGSRRMLSGFRRPSAVLKSSSSPSTSIQTIVTSGLP
jgi:hypothetical protein